MNRKALTFTLNSEAANIRNIYYTTAYFELENLINPATAKPYTDEEIEAIRNNADTDDDSCIAGGALIGMQAYDTGRIFWYDADSSREIISHADPLQMNGDTGELKAADGNTAAQAI